MFRPSRVTRRSGLEDEIGTKNEKPTHVARYDHDSTASQRSRVSSSSQLRLNVDAGAGAGAGANEMNEGNDSWI